MNRQQQSPRIASLEMNRFIQRVDSRVHSFNSNSCSKHRYFGGEFGEQLRECIQAE